MSLGVDEDSVSVPWVRGGQVDRAKRHTRPQHVGDDYRDKERQDAWPTDPRGDTRHDSLSKVEHGVSRVDELIERERLPAWTSGSGRVRPRARRP